MTNSTTPSTIPNPRAVACSTCRAEVGEPCVVVRPGPWVRRINNYGDSYFHVARRETAVAVVPRQVTVDDIREPLEFSDRH